MITAHSAIGSKTNLYAKPAFPAAIAFGSKPSEPAPRSPEPSPKDTVAISAKPQSSATQSSTSSPAANNTPALPKPEQDPEHIFYDEQGTNALTSKTFAISQNTEAGLTDILSDDKGVDLNDTAEFEPIPGEKLSDILLTMRNPSTPHAVQRAEAYQTFLSDREIHKNPFDKRSLHGLRLNSHRVRGSIVEFLRWNSSKGEVLRVRDVSQNEPGTEVFYLDQQILLPIPLNLKNPTDPYTGEILSGYLPAAPFPAYQVVQWGDALYVDHHVLPLESTPGDNEALLPLPTDPATLAALQDTARKQIEDVKTILQSPVGNAYELAHQPTGLTVIMPGISPAILILAKLLCDSTMQDKICQRHRQLFNSSETEAQNEVSTLAALAKQFIRAVGPNTYHPEEAENQPLHWKGWQD